MTLRELIEKMPSTTQVFVDRADVVGGCTKRLAYDVWEELFETREQLDVWWIHPIDDGTLYIVAAPSKGGTE